MKSFKIKIGSLWIEFGPQRLAFGPRGTRFLGRHFTVFAAQEVLRPHVTQPRGRGRFWREFLPEVPVKVFQEFFRGVGEDVFNLWCEASKPTTPEELAVADWVLLGADDAILSEHLKRDIGPDGAFTLRRQSMLDLWDAMVDAAETPIKLHDLTEAGRPLLASRVAGGQLESKLLTYYPCGLRGGPPGWYATPRDWLSRKQSFDIFERHGGRRLFDAMSQLRRLLGGGGRSRHRA